MTTKTKISSTQELEIKSTFYDLPSKIHPVEMSCDSIICSYSDSEGVIQNLSNKWYQIVPTLTLALMSITVQPQPSALLPCLQHDTSQKPTPTFLLSTHHSHRRYRLGLPSTWQLATIEGAKTHLYVWSRLDMSMNWVGCLYHSTHYDTSDKPRESPTTTIHCETQHNRLGLHPYDP